MSRRYVTSDDLKKSQTPVSDGIVRKQFVNEAVTLEDGTKATAGTTVSKTRVFCISTAAIDRDLDSINPKGWNLDAFRKNPICLFAHDYSSLPIGKCTDIKIVGGKLIASTEFADHEMAETVLRLVDGGFLNATSVGFRPIKYSLNETRKGVDYEQQELLEYSIVPVPANPEALIVRRELIGDVKLLQDWAVKMLEVTKGENPFAKPPSDAKPKPGADDPQPKPAGNDDAPDGGEGTEPDGGADEDTEPDPDAKKAIASAVAAIAAALKTLPSAVARAVQGGCDCMAKTEHKAESCSCCKNGQCAGSCCAKAEVAEITKAGRVLSAKNEAKVRAAHGHLDEVLKALPSMQNDDEGQAAAGDVIEKDGEIVIDLDTVEFVNDTDTSLSEKDVAEAMAAALKNALGSEFHTAIASTVKSETQSALNRMRGRLD